jgi:RimJ/RimL family protein N-acetyltransferase
MIIKGKKVYIKKGFSNKEFSEMLKWFKDIEVVRYFSVAKRVLSFKNIEELKSFSRERKTTILFGMYTNRSNKLIGYTILTDFKDKRCEFGITIGNKKYWGKGIGLEATKLMVEYAFHKLKLEKVYLTTSEFNKNAIKVYKKVGFKIIKKIPNDREVYHNNKWVKSGTVCMEITKVK